jgi:hypothetical protein
MDNSGIRIADIRRCAAVPHAQSPPEFAAGFTGNSGIRRLCHGGLRNLRFRISIFCGGNMDSGKSDRYDDGGQNSKKCFFHRYPLLRGLSRAVKQSAQFITFSDNIKRMVKNEEKMRRIAHAAKMPVKPVQQNVFTRNYHWTLPFCVLH